MWDSEGGKGNGECGMRKEELRIQNAEIGKDRRGKVN